MVEHKEALLWQFDLHGASFCCPSQCALHDGRVVAIVINTAECVGDTAEQLCHRKRGKEWAACLQLLEQSRDTLTVPTVPTGPAGRSSTADSSGIGTSSGELGEVAVSAEPAGSGLVIPVAIAAAVAADHLHLVAPWLDDGGPADARFDRARLGSDDAAPLRHGETLLRDIIRRPSRREDGRRLASNLYTFLSPAAFWPRATPLCSTPPPSQQALYNRRSSLQ